MIPPAFFSCLKPGSVVSLIDGFDFAITIGGFESTASEWGYNPFQNVYPKGSITPSGFKGFTVVGAILSTFGSISHTPSGFVIRLQGNLSQNAFTRVSFQNLGDLLSSSASSFGYSPINDYTEWSWSGLSSTFPNANGWDVIGNIKGFSIDRINSSKTLTGIYTTLSQGTPTITVGGSFNRTSNSYWTPENGASWNGTSWQQGSGENWIYLDVIGSWASGFRPSSVDVTVTGLTNNWSVGVSGATQNFGSGSTSSSTIHLPLSFTEDITFIGLDFDDVNTSTRLVSIVFNT